MLYVLLWGLGCFCCCLVSGLVFFSFFFSLSSSIGFASAWLNSLSEQLQQALSSIGAKGPCVCWERKPLFKAQCKSEPVFPAVSTTPQKNLKRSCGMWSFTGIHSTVCSEWEWSSKCSWTGLQYEQPHKQNT